MICSLQVKLDRLSLKKWVSRNCRGSATAGVGRDVLWQRIRHEVGLPGSEKERHKVISLLGMAFRDLNMKTTCVTKRGVKVYNGIQLIGV